MAPRFAKSKRRLTPEVQRLVDDEVRKLLDDPMAGEPKTGPLKGVRVTKFKAETVTLLLAYEFNARLNQIELLDAAPHQGFYEGLTRYVKGR